MTLLRTMIGALLVVLSASCQKGGTMDSVSVTPTEVVIAEGRAQQFVATAHFTDGSSIVWSSAVNWSATPDLTTTGTGSIGTSLGNYGLFSSGSGTGNFTVKAVDVANNLIGTAKIYVRRPEITISPARAYMPLHGGTNNHFSHQFSALATLVKSEGTLTTTVDLTSAVTWTTTGGDSATVSASGLVTTSTVTTGTTVVETAYRLPAGDLISSASSTVTVTGTEVQSIDITPAGSILIAPSSISVTATGNYADTPATQDFTDAVIWTSSDPSIADFLTANILSTTTKTGTVTVRARDRISNISSSATFTVQ